MLRYSEIMGGQDFIQIGWDVSRQDGKRNQDIRRMCDGRPLKIVYERIKPGEFGVKWNHRTKGISHK